ncbi:hypothetical protein JST97_07090 [bacterium]|nr:hypothetical protein [bacterium]
MSNLAKALVPIIGVVGLGAAAFYLTKHGGSMGGHNTVDLARSTPQKAFFWMAAEMRDEFSAEKLVAQIGKARKDYQGFAKFCDDFAKEAGKTPEEMAKIYAASGYLAIYTQGDKDYIDPEPKEMPVDLVLDCQLYDPKAAEGLLTNIKAKSKSETLVGQTVYVSDKDFCLCIAGDSLLIANSKAMMEKAINAAVSHKNTLSEDENFKKAMAKVPNLAHGNGSAAYLNLNPFWGTMEKVPQLARYTDADTYKGLRSLPYVVGGVSIQNGQTRGEAFLAIDSQTQTDLAKAFLKKPTPANGLAAAVPDAWGSFQAFDTFYVYELLQAILRLAPMGRMGVTMGLSQVGLGPNGDREKKIRKAFNGQTAWSVDMSQASKAGAESVDQAASKGKTTACKSNLKNIGTALEMYSTDNAGRYPTSLAPLSPMYLKQIPTCPAAGKDSYSETYKMGVEPDSYSFNCSDKEAHDLAYTSEEGLKGKDASAVAEAGPDPTNQILGSLLLGVSDATAARELLNELGSWEKLDIDGKEAWHMNSGGTDTYWMLLEKPSVVAFGFGPKGKESLQAVAQAASGKLPSLAQRSNFSNFAGKFSKDSVEMSFVNLKSLVTQVREAAAKSNPEEKAGIEQMLALVESQLSDDLGSIQVEVDGIRYTNEGSAGILGAGAALTLPILVPNFMKARGQGQLTACKSNEKNLATALEMYASDNAGRYPTSMAPLSPMYLKQIPTCPAASTDTYSETYQMRATPDGFSFYCRGNHHGTLAPENYPAYNAETGLIDHP